MKNGLFWIIGLGVIAVALDRNRDGMGSLAVSPFVLDTPAGETVEPYGDQAPTPAPVDYTDPEAAYQPASYVAQEYRPAPFAPVFANTPTAPVKQASPSGGSFWDQLNSTPAAVFPMIQIPKAAKRVVVRKASPPPVSNMNVPLIVGGILAAGLLTAIAATR